MLELEYHYSDVQHRANLKTRKQKFRKQSGEKFRPAPDGVYMGRYKVCRRLEVL